MQHAGQPAGDGRRVPAGLDAVPAGLEAVELHVGVRHEGGEDADGVGATADTGGHGIGQPAAALEDLLARLVADHPLVLAHHQRERVRSGHRPEHVVRRLDVGDPVAHRLVDGVLQRARAGGDGDDLGAEQPHPGHVERLAAGVLLAHVDDAVEAEQRGRGGGGDAVLAGAGLGDDPLLADLLGQQRLAQHVVDLVRAGVVEVLALEQDARAAGVLGELGHIGQRRGTAGVVAQQAGEFGAEGRVGLGLVERGGQVVDGGDERLGDEPAAVRAEVARGIRNGRGHGQLQDAKGRRTASAVPSPADEAARRIHGRSLPSVAESVPRWFTEHGDGHAAWYIERFRRLAEAGDDLDGEARFVDAMVARGSRILDAGCGPGRVGAALQARGHTVVGVDVDAALIEAARADHPGPRWLVADLASLELDEAPFDLAVLAGNVLVFVAPGSEAHGPGAGRGPRPAGRRGRDGLRDRPRLCGVRSGSRRGGGRAGSRAPLRHLGSAAVAARCRLGGYGAAQAVVSHPVDLVQTRGQ